MMDDGRIDRVIDDVARALTAGETSAELRARIVERLESRTKTRRSIWLVPTLAAAALVLIAVFAGREVRRMPSDAMPPVARGSDLLLRSAERPDVTRALPPPATSASPRRRTFAIEPSPFEQDVAPLAVSRMTFSHIESESIQLEPLQAIAPIAVAPLDLPEGDRP